VIGLAGDFPHPITVSFTLDPIHVMRRPLRASLLAAIPVLASCSTPTAPPVDRVLPGYSVAPGTPDGPGAPQVADTTTTRIDINDPSRPMFGG